MSSSPHIPSPPTPLPTPPQPPAAQFTTVQEAVLFSAALRLPATVDGPTRAEFVAEVIELLELRNIASRRVGEVGAGDSLSPAERKILTIAVELAANAPIMFLGACGLVVRAGGTGPAGGHTSRESRAEGVEGGASLNRGCRGGPARVQF